MLQRHANAFLDYCRLASFSKRSRQALSIRLDEFHIFLQIQRIRKSNDLTYLDLSSFVADFKQPSIHVTKSRAWALRQFYHFLTLQGHVRDNIASGRPYPNIEKTVPAFLTQEELNRLIRRFSEKTASPWGLRNLVIVVLVCQMWPDAFVLRRIFISIFLAPKTGI